jgi:hypothetical protein
MPIFPDAKWLDFLKAGLPVFFGLALACGVALYLDHNALLPMRIPEAIGLSIALVGLLSGGLAVGLLLDAAYRGIVWFVSPRWHGRLSKKLAAKTKREFTKYIPHLSSKEREIFGVLLHQNRRTFTNTEDCGYATELLSLGYVRMIARDGQSVQYLEFPFGIPDPVWDALQENREAFPYEPPQRSRRDRVPADPAPWRRPGPP